MREYATRLHEALKPILGRVAQFEATDGEVEAFDLLILDAPLLSESADKHAQTIHVAVYELIEAWEDWKRTRPMAGPNVRISTGPRMIDKADQLERALAPPIAKCLETVFDLLDQKVPQNKIAECLDWKDQFGEWDHERVRLEIAAGREACKPATKQILRIDLTSRYGDVLRLWPALMDRKAHDQRQIEAAKPVAPESLEELIAQKVSVKQIAEMKGISQEEVEERAKQMGVRIPGMKSVLMMAVSPPEEMSEEEEFEELQRLILATAGFKPKSDDKQNAKALHAKGLNPTEIAKILRVYTGRIFHVLEVAEWTEGAAA